MVYNSGMNLGDFVRKRGDLISVGVPFYKRDSRRIVLGMDYNWHANIISDNETERMLKLWPPLISEG